VKFADVGLPPARLLADHFQEIGPHKFGRANPDVDEYADAERKGRLVYVVAHRAGEMVGYMALVLRPHPHHRHIKVAVDDLHYLIPSLRGLGMGKQLIEFAEREAIKRGAQIICMRCSAHQPHGHIYESMDYELTDLVYTKDLRTQEQPDV
jgi:GNAT superfamily N-acetyltransferase